MDPKEELVQCSIAAWYDKFADITFKTIVIPLPQGVADWLVEDGLFILEGSNAFPTRGKLEGILTEDDYQDWSSDDENDKAEDSDNTSNGSKSPAPTSVDLAAFIDHVHSAIEDLGGNVAPKFTWSCPIDALWMKGNSLQCTNADEVLLLLKSSDRVAHDICHALQDVYGHNDEAAIEQPTSSAKQQEQQQQETSTRVLSECEEGSNGNVSRSTFQHVLALRKWYDLLPGREFRCFVKDNKLLGVSQRDLTQRFDFLPAELPDLRHRISAFHDRHIAGKFHLRCFVYDCYVPSSRTAAVRLIDFNPVGGTTAPLLFQWEELLLQNTQDMHEKQEKSLKTIKSGSTSANVDMTLGVNKHSDTDADDHPPTVVPGSEFEFRILTEQVPLRPATAAYGVPFDFVDTSEGSALSRLLDANGSLTGGGADAATRALFESLQK